MSAYTAALETLRRCRAGLAAGPSAGERERLLELMDEALALLAAGASRRRLPTAAVAQRVAHLERLLADRPAGERAAIIRARLGLSRSRYYELRRVRISPDSHARESQL